MQSNQQSLVHFNQFLNKLRASPLDSQTISDYEQKYNIRAYNISSITLEEAQTIYTSIYAKFYKSNNHMKSSNWFQNQLRLFVWIVVGHAHLVGRMIQLFADSDWVFLGKIFDRKDPKLFQYQCHCLYLSNKGVNWQAQQQAKLSQIINAHKPEKTKIRWNEISKLLFQKSNKRFLRTPKQCRQRWNNHLDPKKMKGLWKRQEYIRMFQFVRDHGKKWAQLVKELNNVRNQHSIKNKFNSMVKRHLKTCKEKGERQPASEQDLYNQIIEKVQSAIFNQKYCKNHNQIDNELECQQEIRPLKRNPYTNQRRTSGFVQKLMQKLKQFPSQQELKKKQQQRQTKQLKEQQKKFMKQKVRQEKNNNSYGDDDEQDQSEQEERVGEDEDQQLENYNEESQQESINKVKVPERDMGIRMPHSYRPMIIGSDMSRMMMGNNKQDVKINYDFGGNIMMSKMTEQRPRQKNENIQTSTSLSSHNPLLRFYPNGY